MINDDNNNNDTLSMLKTGVWEKNIETLILNHRQISKLDLALEAFVNLRKLQLVDNCISKIEGLSRCKLLEEVSLEKNKISSIENIGHLRYLKKLDLGRNRIRRIESGLSQLESLT
jgi:Leucine-rich repeat (LRR) protein